MLVEKRETTAGWTSSSSTVTDTDKYAIQNWRHDVVAILNESGHRVLGARFDPDGVANGLPRADVNYDGAVNGTDSGLITAATSSYTVRCDITLNRVVDVNDMNIYTTDTMTSLGRERFSFGPDHAQGGGHRFAFTGREIHFEDSNLYDMRNRSLRADLGIWTRRDPLGYVDGPNLYGYVMAPIRATDPMGLCATCNSTKQSAVFGGGATGNLVAWWWVPYLPYMRAPESSPTPQGPDTQSEPTGPPTPVPLSPPVYNTPGNKPVNLPEGDPVGECYDYCSKNQKDLGVNLCISGVHSICTCDENIKKLYPKLPFGELRACVLKHEAINSEARCCLADGTLGYKPSWTPPIPYALPWPTCVPVCNELQAWIASLECVKSISCGADAACATEKATLESEIEVEIAETAAACADCNKLNEKLDRLLDQAQAKYTTPPPVLPTCAPLP